MWRRDAVMAPWPSYPFCEVGKTGKRVGYITMALWKSGLFPLVVFANNVNWDTHSTLPSMSFTLAFHILSGFEGSAKTRSERLE